MFFFFFPLNPFPSNPLPLNLLPPVCKERRHFAILVCVSCEWPPKKRRKTAHRQQHFTKTPIYVGKRKCLFSLCGPHVSP